MSRTQLPGMFWLLKRLGNSQTASALCCNDLGYLYAFSDVEKAYDFQYGKLDSAWTTRAVRHRELPSLGEELKQHGYKGLCFDCAPDGTGGRKMDSPEIEALAQAAARPR